MGHLPSRTAKRSGDTDENQERKRVKQTQSLPDKDMKEHYDRGALGKVGLSGINRPQLLTGLS
jgi:hypothetical protein